MSDHKLFYYPYASFTDAQLPLLKVAALYFDKLTILDPMRASWDSIGAEASVSKAVRQLDEAGILQIVSPSEVLAKYDGPLAEAIRKDMCDPEFLELCERHAGATGKRRWTLALAKVPSGLRADEAMQGLMGNFARTVSDEAGSYAEGAGDHLIELNEFAEEGDLYDEYRMIGKTEIEYRYADYPLALGEAIMMNHALFAGLLHVKATPITDESFHNRALRHKFERVRQEPQIQDAIADRARKRQLAIDELAATALTDTHLDLPVLNPKMRLEDILEYRLKHESALGEARRELGWMARRIEAEPWSKDFAEKLEHDTIPDVADKLDEARKARDDWLLSKRGRMGLKGTGVAVGAAAAVLSVFTAPVTPIALTVAGLGLVSGAAVPGGEWLLDWMEGRKTVQENGLHYLLQL